LPVGKTARWRNDLSHTDYVLTPISNLADGCRRFKLSSTRDGKQRTEKVRACQTGQGDWNIS
jgi:surface antigen